MLAGALAELEGGAGGVVTSSGMAAITLITAQLGPDDLLVVPHDCYGGSYRLFKAQAARGLYQVEFVDFSDKAALAAALARKPKLVWIETPSNPLLRIIDIAAVARLAHAVDALVVVDNTFLSPALQQPIALGADIVVHSTTKYLNGHSDVVGGAVVWKDAARRRTARLVVQLSGSVGRAVRQLSDPARPAHAAAAPARASGECDCAGATCSPRIRPWKKYIFRVWRRIRAMRSRRASSAASARC